MIKEQEKTLGENAVKYFDETEVPVIRKQRRVVLGIFYAILGVYLAISGGMLGWYLTLPYKSPTITTVKVIQFVTSGIFIIGVFLYMGIVYKRVNRYYKLCRHLLSGIREVYMGSFLEYDETLEVKEGVEFKSLVFIEWNKYKNDFFERKVLVFNEKPFPEIEEKANVKFITQGNVLLSYEIL